jgi:probable F420-dependent oxidoreductase
LVFTRAVSRRPVAPVSRRPGDRVVAGSRAAGAGIVCGVRFGIVLFTSDRGITPAAAARAAEERGFDTFYVPEHTHIPVKRAAAHPGTGDASLPDDRYLRTLDPWVALGSAAAVTSRIELSTAVALPVEHDPITLAKTIATLDHLSGGRVTLGAGFGWNTDELADHHVPGSRRRTALREYLEAMRALWSQDEASYEGEFVSFGASWAWPKPARGTVPVLIGAGGTDKTFGWISRHADGWITTPQDDGIAARTARLQEIWAGAGRAGAPRVVALDGRPDPDRLARWAQAGVTDAVYGLPDRGPDEVLAYLDRLALRLDQRG